MMYQTFMVIIDYLTYSKKVSIDAQGKLVESIIQIPQRSGQNGLIWGGEIEIDASMNNAFKKLANGDTSEKELYKFLISVELIYSIKSEEILVYSIVLDGSRTKTTKSDSSIKCSVPDTK